MDKSLYSRRSNLVIGFHGCDKTVVDAVVAGKTDLLSSTNDYDWLGNGIEDTFAFLDMALPIHNFTYIQAYRAKSVKLRQPSWYLLIHPSHNIHHFIVYHLNFIEIPTNSFIMIYPIAQATEFV